MFDVPEITEQELNSMLGEIQFAVPPSKDHATSGRKYTSPYWEFWKKAKEMMVANPGRWTLVMPSVSPYTAGNIRGGRNSQFDPDEFEVTTRAVKNHPKRYVTLYMRYIGENGEFADNDA